MEYLLRAEYRRDDNRKRIDPTEIRAVLRTVQAAGIGEADDAARTMAVANLKVGERIIGIEVREDHL